VVVNRAVAVVPFWLVVFPVQVTIVLLTGEAGVQAASARPLIAKQAISSACISACRRRIRLGPATVCFCPRAGFFADAGESQYPQAKPPSEQPQHALKSTRAKP